MAVQRWHLTDKVPLFYLKDPCSLSVLGPPDSRISCHAHRESTWTNITARCHKCTKVPSYGLPGTRRKISRAEHREPTWANNMACARHKCTKVPSCGLPGTRDQRSTTYVGEHGSAHMPQMCETTIVRSALTHQKISRAEHREPTWISYETRHPRKRRRQRRLRKQRKRRRRCGRRSQRRAAGQASGRPKSAARVETISTINYLDKTDMPPKIKVTAIEPNSSALPPK